MKPKWRTGVSLNIEGILPTKKKFKINFLADLAQLYNSDYMCITESHLRDDVFDAEIHIKGFNLYRQDRKNRNQGGVLIYVKDTIISNSLLSSSNEFCEVIVLEFPQEKQLLINVYRPPDCPEQLF